MITIQAVLFFIVGLLVTGIDVILFRLIHQRVGWNRYVANCLSTSAAITVSMVANRHVVFRPDQFDLASGTVRFLAITLISAWGIQNAVLWILAQNKFLDDILQQSVSTTSRMVGFKQCFLTGATVHKLAAICCGITWNFCWYRWWVFV